MSLQLPFLPLEFNFQGPRVDKNSHESLVERKRTLPCPRVGRCPSPRCHADGCCVPAEAGRPGMASDHFRAARWGHAGPMRDPHLPSNLDCPALGGHGGFVWWRIPPAMLWKLSSRAEGVGCVLGVRNEKDHRSGHKDLNVSEFWTHTESKGSKMLPD